MKLLKKDFIYRIFSLLFIICLLTNSSCTEDEDNMVFNPEPTTSNEKRILSFTLKLDSEYSLPLKATIDEENKKISTAVGIDEYWRDYYMKGRATVNLSPNATIFPDPSAVRDYSVPVVYTVTGEDGSEQEYVVEVSKLSMKITSVNKTTFEPGENMIIYGENLIADKWANDVFLIENGVEYPVYYNESNYYTSTQFSIRIHDHLEIGEYTLKVRAFQADSIEYDVPITVDYKDKSRKITAISPGKVMDNSTAPPLYQFRFQTYTRFLGASTYDQTNNAKVYLVDASNESIKHLCNNIGKSWSEKFTNIGFYSTVPNSVKPGEYYVEVDYDGVIRYPEPISFPW